MQLTILKEKVNQMISTREIYSLLSKETYQINKVQYRNSIMMGENIMALLKMGYDMVLESITLRMEIFMKECGKKIIVMERAFIITQIQKSIEGTIDKGKETDLEFLTIKMEIDMKETGKMAIQKVLEHIIIALEKCIWETIEIIKGVEEVDTLIKMELFMMGIGKMETKKELDAISMVMGFTWENATQVSDMEKEYTCLKMVLVMKATGLRGKEKDGEFISMPMEASTLASIKEATGKAQVCMSITIKKYIKEIGKRIKRMAMESLYQQTAKYKQDFIKITIILEQVLQKWNELI